MSRDVFSARDLMFTEIMYLLINSGGNDDKIYTNIKLQRFYVRWIFVLFNRRDRFFIFIYRSIIWVGNIVIKLLLVLIFLKELMLQVSRSNFTTIRNVSGRSYHTLLAPQHKCQFLQHHQQRNRQHSQLLN